ncbi:hypothetical protein CC1G_11045 [Coprinopsis cinerea okayama7|uniref:Uncharacterized protein n=1 Tax=Coprinopsis cinerea (strain Okayama-7 / 130 / ATCC MYA-4618 / FGSC 9003) TaxID=240176 RepID=A8NIU5_COPC7|nr:hypothetical protein CC1G_11045 [Coprinopsis cinerea okayama7\|eukprot:XP_001834075.2 hypothetical protein CC1G_11045 [Coprinopsis cinerea okayama7\
MYPNNNYPMPQSGMYNQPMGSHWQSQYWNPPGVVVNLGNGTGNTGYGHQANGSPRTFKDRLIHMLPKRERKKTTVFVKSYGPINVSLGHRKRPRSTPPVFFGPPHVFYPPYAPQFPEAAIPRPPPSNKPLGARDEYSSGSQERQDEPPMASTVPPAVGSAAGSGPLLQSAQPFPSGHVAADQPAFSSAQGGRDSGMLERPHEANLPTAPAGAALSSAPSAPPAMSSANYRPSAPYNAGGLGYRDFGLATRPDEYSQMSQYPAQMPPYSAQQFPQPYYGSIQAQGRGDNAPVIPPGIWP